MLRLLLSCALLTNVCWFPASGHAQEYGANVGFVPPELEPRPKNGIAAVIVGSVLLGGALESLALIGLCGPNDRIFPSERACKLTNASVGVVSVAIGVPVLALGIVRRKHYKAWREARSRSPHALESLRVTPLTRGGGLSWSTRF